MQRLSFRSSADSDGHCESPTTQDISNTVNPIVFVTKVDGCRHDGIGPLVKGRIGRKQEVRRNDHAIGILGTD